MNQSSVDVPCFTSSLCYSRSESPFIKSEISSFEFKDKYSHQCWRCCLLNIPSHENCPRPHQARSLEKWNLPDETDLPSLGVSSIASPSQWSSWIISVTWSLAIWRSSFIGKKSEQCFHFLHFIIVRWGGKVTKYPSIVILSSIVLTGVTAVGYLRFR